MIDETGVRGLTRHIYIPHSRGRLKIKVQVVALKGRKQPSDTLKALYLSIYIRSYLFTPYIRHFVNYIRLYMIDLRKIIRVGIPV